MTTEAGAWAARAPARTDDDDDMDIVASRTVRDLWEEAARTHRDRTFLVEEDRAGRVRELTYGESAARIAQTAHLFRSLGVRRGDAVAVHLGNGAELLECLFGLASIGAVTVPLHPRSTADECRRTIERVAARLVVAEPGVRPAAGYGDGRRVLLARTWTGDPGDPGARPGGEDGADGDGGTLDYARARDAQPTTLPEDDATSPEDVACIVFTSGSTAVAKGVELTHANLLFSGRYVTWQAALTPADRLATTMPACHVNFLLNALLPVVTAGAALVSIETYSASRFWSQVRRHDATVVQAIAMIVRTLLLQPPTPGDRDHRVREVLYYLPITDEQKQTFERRFGARVLNSYGTSETLVGVLTDPPTGERRWPSVGRVGPGYQARVVTDDGREAAPGEPGEIQVRGVPGRTLMRGYAGDPEATAAVLDPDGWFRTGDIGTVDADGWFFFLDRRSAFIKRAGENVSPAEVEAVLQQHPEVAEASVVGRPHPVLDEVVTAVVVPVPGARPTADELRRFCADRLADFKVPASVEVVDRLPRTPTYKIARHDLSVRPPGRVAPTQIGR
ncbi:MAG TPA: AMP-binding protein [Cellulomonas sp.]